MPHDEDDEEAVCERFEAELAALEGGSQSRRRREGQRRTDAVRAEEDAARNGNALAHAVAAVVAAVAPRVSLASEVKEKGEESRTHQRLSNPFRLTMSPNHHESATMLAKPKVAHRPNERLLDVRRSECHVRSDWQANRACETMARTLMALVKVDGLCHGDGPRNCQA